MNEAPLPSSSHAHTLDKPPFFTKPPKKCFYYLYKKLEREGHMGLANFWATCVAPEREREKQKTNAALGGFLRVRVEDEGVKRPVL